MKITAFLMRFAAVLVCAVMLVSCSAEPTGDPFLPFRGEPKAEISLVFGGQRSEFSYSMGTVSFKAPNELVGYSMFLSEGKVCIGYGELSFNVSSRAGRLLYLCESVFSPKGAVSVTAEKSGNKTFTAVKTEAYVYVFSSDGMPTSVSGTFDGEDFEMRFVGFTVDGE